jgi:hypothetical protein
VKGSHCLVLLLAALGLALAPPQARLVQVETASAQYQNLQAEALRFFRAVRNGDKPTLARLAPDAGREAVRKDLEDPTSPIARLLLTGSRAMRGRFMSVQTPRVTLLRQRDATDRAIVCFSDPRQPFNTPATTAELPAVDSNHAEMCFPFTIADKHWSVILAGR